MDINAAIIVLEDLVSRESVVFAAILGAMILILLIASVARRRAPQSEAHDHDASDTRPPRTRTTSGDMNIPRMDTDTPAMGDDLSAAAWLQRGATPDKPVAPASFDPVAAEAARLADIERHMLALRDLYESGLIAPEIYILKSREFAKGADIPTPDPL